MNEVNSHEWNCWKGLNIFLKFHYFLFSSKSVHIIVQFRRRTISFPKKFEQFKLRFKCCQENVRHHEFRLFKFFKSHFMLFASYIYWPSRRWFSDTWRLAEFGGAQPQIRKRKFVPEKAVHFSGGFSLEIRCQNSSLHSHGRSRNSVGRFHSIHLEFKHLGVRKILD